VFPDQGGRFKHLTGRVRRELAKHALTLLDHFRQVGETTRLPLSRQQARYSLLTLNHWTNSQVTHDLLGRSLRIPRPINSSDRQPTDEPGTGKELVARGIIRCLYSASDWEPVLPLKRISNSMRLIRMRADAAGILRVGKTRVSLDSVIAAFNEGATPEEIVRQYDVIALADLYAVIGYYLENQSEIDAYLAKRHTQRAQLRQELEARHQPQGIRQRLISRSKNP
jgi:uncharacterized protein (DUF433 family)